MANRYSQNFTLVDIFNNKKLKNKLPIINYKEKETEDGKLSRTTNLKTVTRLAFDTATSSARPFYKPIITHRRGNRMEIGGTLIGDLNSAVDSVYNALLSQKTVMKFTANNSEVIRTALKEGANNKRRYGIDSKLYLRAQSMLEIEGMSKRQIQALMNDIMENIIYGDNFPLTQKKYNLEQLPTKSHYNYQQRVEKWKMKIGE